MEETQRRVKERSSFAVTCRLLNQFLKENRSYEDLKGIEMLYQPQDQAKEYQPPPTMNLFPGPDPSTRNQNKINSDKVSEEKIAISEDSLQDTVTIPKASAEEKLQKEKEMNAQLTIFYNGKVMIFDNFPAMKAKDLMEMASKGSSCLPQSGNGISDSAARVTPAPPLPSEPRASVNLSSMPIARRASLHRFLEKRKNRINSNAPYLAKHSSEMEPTSTKSEKNQPWLALGHSSSFNSN